MPNAQNVLNVIAGQMALLAPVKGASEVQDWLGSQIQVLAQLTNTYKTADDAWFNLATQFSRGIAPGLQDYAGKKLSNGKTLTQGNINAIAAAANRVAAAAGLGSTVEGSGMNKAVLFGGIAVLALAGLWAYGRMKRDSGRRSLGDGRDIEEVDEDEFDGIPGDEEEEFDGVDDLESEPEDALDGYHKKKRKSRRKAKKVEWSRSYAE